MVRSRQELQPRKQVLECHGKIRGARHDNNPPLGASAPGTAIVAVSVRQAWCNSCMSLSLNRRAVCKAVVS